MNDAPKSSPPDSAPGAVSWRVYDAPSRAAAYDHWTTITESRATARALEAADLRLGDSVLEVAVGTGLLFSRLAQVDGLRRCIGVEPAKAMLQRACRRVAHQLNEYGALCRADARDLPFPPSTFDVIVNCYMLDLLPESDILRVLQEFRRTLKPGGRLVLLVMARQSWIVQGIWLSLYALSPSLVGCCRPVRLSGFLTAGRWLIQQSEQISQNGFRSHLILARPS